MSERSRGLLHFLWFEKVVISTLWVPRKLAAIPLAGMDIARSTFDEAIARVVQRSELSARPGSIYCCSRIARIEKRKENERGRWRRSAVIWFERGVVQSWNVWYLLNGRTAGLGREIQPTRILKVSSALVDQLPFRVNPYPLVQK